QTVASPQHPLADDAPRPWYVLALLLPALIAAILLGVLAFMSAWWLWPVVVALGVPPLIIVWPKPGEGNGAAWHLRQFQRPR
ncbi:MAG: hypothetical protein OEM94_08910, partial [Acidimicrobiia bacterium]|nr:hypothetical protein [Acidimicrobiia bacterium]